MHLDTSCFASSLVLQLLPFTGSRLSVLKKDSASASSHGLPGHDMDRATPWDSRRRWNAREACWEPLSSRKTRSKSSGGYPSDRLLERIRDRLLGHAPGHRPTHDLPAERVDHGCEAGPSFARPDAGVAARPWLVAGLDAERPRPRGSRAGRPSRPNDLLYRIGLIPPNDSSILSSLYQWMYSSRASMKPWIDYPDQPRPQKNSTLSRPKNFSIAELSGEQLFFDMERVIPYLLYPSIQPGHR